MHGCENYLTRNLRLLLKLSEQLNYRRRHPVGDPTIDMLAASLSGLEGAFRDAVARSMKPELTLSLRIQFYRVIVALARTMRQTREAAGLPRELPTDVFLLLGRVRASASQRLYGADLSDALAIQLLGAVEKLMLAVIQSTPQAYADPAPGTTPSAVEPNGQTAPIARTPPH
jgi:hypothetical protein